MNSSQREFDASGKAPTQTDRLEAIFRARPNVWIGLPELAGELGAYAVHSRACDLRKRFRLEGGRLENRQRVDCTTGQRLSYYRYSPGSQPGGMFEGQDGSQMRLWPPSEKETDDGPRANHITVTR